MGLIIGVGGTKPTFAYDYYYGIEWDSTVSNPKPTRIGKMELHQSLPVQSLMRRCLLNDDGAVNYYLHANDSTKRDNGAAANLTGADGQYMVEMPDAYVRFETGVARFPPLAQGLHFSRRSDRSAFNNQVGGGCKHRCRLSRWQQRCDT